MIDIAELERKRFLAFQFFYLQIAEAKKELEKKLDGLKSSEVQRKKEKEKCHCHCQKN
jgi:hypothetical protein